MPGPQTQIPYFQPLCRRTLDSYLCLFGFEAIAVKHDNVEVKTVAAYSNNEVVLRISYWPEDFPNYQLMVGLGLHQARRYAVDSGIGLWYAVPVDKQEWWSFHDERELEVTLSHLRDDVLPRYAEPLWKDSQLLRQLITRYHNEQDAKIEAEKADRKRRQAEAAFKAKNYQEALRIYSGFSPVDLTPLDEKRIAIARKSV